MGRRRILSASFPKRRVAERATRRGKENTTARNKGKGTLRLPGPKYKPKIRPALRIEAKTIAGRFYQLLSGHVIIAPFSKGKWEWIGTDQCWWCRQGRQHGHTLRNRRGFGYNVREAAEQHGRQRANGNGAYTEDVLASRERRA